MNERLDPNQYPEQILTNIQDVTNKQTTKQDKKYLYKHYFSWKLHENSITAEINNNQRVFFV